MVTMGDYYERKRNNYNFDSNPVIKEKLNFEVVQNDKIDKYKKEGWDIFDEFKIKVENIPYDEKNIKVERNTIINDDCLKVINLLPNNYIDLVVTDPPYGDGVGYGRECKTILNNQDESINYKFLDAIYPKMKNNTSLYLFTNWKFEVKLRNYIENKNLFKIRMVLIIVKNNFGLGYGFRNQYEICLVLEKGKPKYNLNNFSNVQNMEHINHNTYTHPHQKGLKLLKKILEHSSKENDLVFDGFLGSGSIIDACKEMKRDYLGVELDKKWFDYINQRIFLGKEREEIK